MQADPSPKPQSPLRIDLVWLIFCLSISTMWCWTSAREIGVTFDEPVYLEEGLEHWRTGSNTELMKLGTMPLPIDLTTMPLYLWEKQRGTPIDLKTEFFTVLPWARMMTACFWWLLLFYAWRTARSLGGPWAGRLAVGLLAFEPTFLAHASLATTDIAVTAMLLAFNFHFRCNREEKWGWRVAWPGVWLGLAILCKASGLVFGGLCMLVLDWQWRRSRREELSPDDQLIPTFRRSFKDMFQIGLVGMAVAFLYCGSDFRPQASFVKWAHQLPDGPLASVMVGVSENLCIFSNAGEGIIRQVRHNMRGHGVYLLGAHQKRALWYYFPVALSIKLALPLLIAPLLLIVLRLGTRGGHILKDNWALICGMALLAFTVLCRVQIGVRLVLPVVAVLTIGVSSALIVVVRELRAQWTQRLAVGLMAGGVAWILFTAARIWPDGLTYINPVWSETNEDYKLISDANYDWGQGLGDLEKWENVHPEHALYVWYYGSDPRIDSLRAKPMQVHMLPIDKPEDYYEHFKGRHLAVSATLVCGSIWDPKVHQAQEFLRRHEPVARTRTFLIYDFTEAGIASVKP